MKTNLKKVGFFTGALIFALVLAACGVKDRVDLRINVKEGDSFEYEIVMTQTVKQNMEQIFSEASESDELPESLAHMDLTEVSVNQEFATTYKINVLEAGKTIKLNTVYEKVKFMMASPMLPFPVTYDSENPQPADSDNAFPINFDFLIGQAITAEITPKGEVKKISGIDEMIEKMTESLGVDQAAANLARQNFESLFSDNTYEQLFQNIALLPPGKISVGESWEVSLNVLQEFPLIVSTKYTLVQRENGEAKIKSESVIETNPNASEVNLGYAKIKYDISGSQTGDFYIEEKTGFVLRGLLNQNLKGTMSMESPLTQAEKIFEDTKMPIDITSEILIRRL